jgi:hypothetical protein
VPPATEPPATEPNGAETNRAETTHVNAAEQTHAPADTEPEELLKKIIDPLLRRLKAELRVDRDRQGLVTDLRF